MHGKVPDEFSKGWSADEKAAFGSLFDELGEALPEPPSGRLRGQLRRAIWSERVRDWGSKLSLAGMATALVVGMVLGRVLFVPPAPAPGPEPATPDLALETQLLSGSPVAARLAAIVNMRQAAQLPTEAAASLVALVRSPDTSVGMQLAALDALLAHTQDAQVFALLADLVDDNDRANPMVQARLREVVERPATQGTKT